MNDTSPEIEQMLRDQLMKRSGSERVLMASRSFDAARTMVMASLSRDLSAEEFRRQLYERIYGEPLPAGFKL